MAKDMTKEERMWGAFCHLGGLGMVVPILGNIAAPLILWMTKHEDSKFVDAQGKRAIDFQITVSIVALPLLLLSWLVWESFLGKGFLVLLAAVALYDLVMITIASVRAHEGQDFTYPLALRFIGHEPAQVAAAPKPAPAPAPVEKAPEQPAPAAKKAAKKAAPKKKAAKKKAAKKKSRR